MLFKKLNFQVGKSAPRPRVLPKEVVSWLVAVVPLRGGFPPRSTFPAASDPAAPGGLAPDALVAEEQEEALFREHALLSGTRQAAEIGFTKSLSCFYSFSFFCFFTDHT